MNIGRIGFDNISKQDNEKSAVLGTLVCAMAFLLMIGSAVTGFADPVDFDSKSPLTTLGVQEKEVSIGNLVADAVRRTGGARVAFVAASELKEIREQIPAGRVSSERITDLLSYPDEPVVVISLTGANIQAALERSVSSHPRKSLGFLQVSGIKFEFDPKAAVGRRIVRVTVGDQPLVAERVYEVAMNRSLAQGALGYWRIWGKKNDMARETNVSTAKAVETFLAQAKNVDYSKADRIVRRP